jgi:hypothetical protein
VNKPTPATAVVVALALGFGLAAVAACGNETTDTDDTVGATATTPPPPTDSSRADPASAETPTSTAAGSPCGVTLAEVQALLPAGSGVTENSTPDPGRCNFTWDDGGPRGIDVAIVPGGRSSFVIPAGYEPLDGFGDEAFSSRAEGRASAFAFVGDDLYAADVVADGAAPAEAGLLDLCLDLLDLVLD